MTDDRGQMTEDRRQRTDDRGQMTEDRRQMTDDRGQMTEDRGQMTEDRGQKTDDRGEIWVSGVRFHGVRNRPPLILLSQISAFRIPTSKFEAFSI
jgi:hypothetical protein